MGKHRKGFIYTGSNNRGSMKAALNHVSKQVPKNDYFYWHLQYKQTRSGVREGGGLHIYIYMYIYIYIFEVPDTR